MYTRKWSVILCGVCSVTCLMKVEPAFLRAQEMPRNGAPHADAPAGSVRLTLEEIKQRVLSNNKLLQLAALNVRSKGFATKAVQANYFPQIIGNSVYFHFNDNLGDVITTRGRVARRFGLGAFPPFSVDVPMIDQNSEFSAITVVQPITDLIKVRAGVRLARADEGIAQAQMEKGTRELISGVEQLFWGLLAVERIQAGAQVAMAGAEEVAKTGIPEARIALVQARQGLQEVGNQIADLQEQLTILLDLPTSTRIELVEPPLPLAPVKSSDEAVALALANSPEIREAEQTICKGEAAVAAGRADYIPSIAVVGGYANNNMIDPVQPNIGYVGVVGSYTFVDWGKRRNTIRERQELVGMANLKLQQTQDDVRKNALKAYREYEYSGVALKFAGELVEMRTEAVKDAGQPAAKFTAAKDLMTAQVDAVKADLAHRIAYVKLMAIIGTQ